VDECDGCQEHRKCPWRRSAGPCRAPVAGAEGEDEEQHQLLPWHAEREHAAWEAIGRVREAATRSGRSAC
jgi:hypothetical protein